MAMTVQQIHPVAHLPLVLGVLRRLERRLVIDRLIPPHPAYQLSCGSRGRSLGPRDSGWASRSSQGGETVGSAGDAGAKQPGLTRAALNDYRWAIRGAVYGQFNTVYSAVASTHWRSMPLPHHGCIRTRRLLPCMEHTQTNRRPQEPPAGLWP